MLFWAFIFNFLMPRSRFIDRREPGEAIGETVVTVLPLPWRHSARLFSALFLFSCYNLSLDSINSIYTTTSVIDVCSCMYLSPSSTPTPALSVLSCLQNALPTTHTPPLILLSSTILVVNIIKASFSVYKRRFACLTASAFKEKSRLITMNMFSNRMNRPE